MARLMLNWDSPEAIEGLGVTTAEYEDAKEILMTKLGGERRKLQAYTDDLEAMKIFMSTCVGNIGKRLCLRCLGGNYSGKKCNRSRLSDINPCKNNHHSLLHDPSRVRDSVRSELPRE